MLRFVENGGVIRGDADWHGYLAAACCFFSQVRTRRGLIITQPSEYRPSILLMPVPPENERITREIVAQCSQRRSRQN